MSDAPPATHYKPGRFVWRLHKFEGKYTLGHLYLCSAPDVITPDILGKIVIYSRKYKPGYSVHNEARIEVGYLTKGGYTVYINFPSPLKEYTPSLKRLVMSVEAWIEKHIGLDGLVCLDQDEIDSQL